MQFFSTDKSIFATKTDLELVRATIETLRAELSKTRMEASELYDKAYHMHARIAKRLRDADKDEAPTPVPDIQPEGDRVTERVLARRRGRAVPK